MSEARIAPAAMVEPIGLVTDRATLEHAFAEASASARLEGQEPSAFVSAQDKRILNGEITAADTIEELKKHYNQY